MCQLMPIKQGSTRKLGVAASHLSSCGLRWGRLPGCSSGTPRCAGRAWGVVRGARAARGVSPRGTSWQRFSGRVSPGPCGSAAPWQLSGPVAPTAAFCDPPAGQADWALLPGGARRPAHGQRGHGVRAVGGAAVPPRGAASLGARPELFSGVGRRRLGSVCWWRVMERSDPDAIIGTSVSPSVRAPFESDVLPLGYLTVHFQSPLSSGQGAVQLSLSLISARVYKLVGGEKHVNKHATKYCRCEDNILILYVNTHVSLHFRTSSHNAQK